MHLWRDELVQDMPINYHLATPRPYDLEANIQAHLLIVQPEEFDVQAILISMYDNALYGNQAHRFAVLHGPLLTVHDLQHHADREQVCSWTGAQCEAWFGWQQIDPGVPLSFRAAMASPSWFNDLRLRYQILMPGMISNLYSLRQHLPLDQEYSCIQWDTANWFIFSPPNLRSHYHHLLRSL